jgi:hypothetical protein
VGEWSRTLGYRAYLSSKIDLELLVRDLTLPFTLAALAAVALAGRRARDDRRVWPFLAGLALVAALAVSFLVHVPLHYTRMAYYLPFFAAPLVAWALASGRRAPLGAAALAALTLYLGAISYLHADDVARFYRFANAGSLRGLDAVAARLPPRQVVATDRCWSFLATWLLRTRTLPALEPADIQPKAELPIARRAHAVLRGGPRGRAIAGRLGVRYALVDPSCTSAAGRRLRPPGWGRPVFASRRLVVVRLR